MALIINPILVFLLTRANPYPLVFKCLRESGVTAFFTRSSAANIPVNMQLCKDLDLDENTYSVSIPLGATVNMGGAAITISVMTLAAVTYARHSSGYWYRYIAVCYRCSFSLWRKWCCWRIVTTNTSRLWFVRHS